MKVEVRKESEFCWSVYVNGVRVVDRESYQVASNVAYHLELPKGVENPSAWDYSESSEVAESIRKHLGGGQ